MTDLTPEKGTQPVDPNDQNQNPANDQIANNKADNQAAQE